MLILDVVAVLLAAVAIFIGWRVTGAVKELSEKLDRVQSTVFDTRQEQRALQEKMENRMAELDVAVQKATGKLRFDPNTSLTHLYEIEPRAQAVLAAFHIGGCASCAVDEDGSLAQAVRERGADLDKVLTALNTLPANGGNGDLRMPNVQFQI